MLSVAKRVGRSRQTEGDEPVHVGPYRLCLELASGGMATVYLAHDGSAGVASRFAAVKLVHAHLANDPGFAEMFVDEAEIASRIRHPNVCSVYDFDVSDGRSYIAMEYLLGESVGALWRKIVRARSVDPRRTAGLAAKVLADACEGLHAAHELTDEHGDALSVVHRDVSPGNIVVTLDGVTKVVDFGVAAAARKRHRTQTGILKGKIAYIAPEYLRGTKADRRSDLWGIGVVAWELVTGQRLFRRGSDVQTLRAVMDEPIRPPSAVRRELPSELDAVVMRALERDPSKRYQSARELARDLARISSRDEVVTTSDVAEWVEGLFPGARDRKEQLLDIAAQIARGEHSADRIPIEVTTPTHVTGALRTGSPRRPTPGELEATRIYDREPYAERAAPGTDAPPAHASSARERGPRSRRALRSWAVAAALGLGALGGGAATWVLDAARTSPPDPEPRAVRSRPAPAQVASRRSANDRAPEPVPLRAAPPPTSPELRLLPGVGFAHGPYVVELVESTSDELVLRVRLDAPPERPSPRAAEAPAPERTNRREPATRGAPPVPDLAALLTE